MSFTTYPSICIPRAINNVKWYEVKTVFEQLFGPGTIERVDIVHKKEDGGKMCRIFVHMIKWNLDDPQINLWRNKLLEPDGEIKLVYNAPWFWKCRASRLDKPIRTISATPYIDDDTSSNTNTVLADFIPSNF